MAFEIFSSNMPKPRITQHITIYCIPETSGAQLSLRPASLLDDADNTVLTNCFP